MVIQKKIFVVIYPIFHTYPVIISIMKHISIFTIFFIVITILKLITANEDPRCNPQELEQYSQEYETCHQKALKTISASKEAPKIITK